MNNKPNKQNFNTKANSNNNINSLTQEKATESNAIQIPEISLPKGGGALKGIDEKFKVNAANGTAAFNIPLPITPGRNGFSPSLTLSYNSGGGNSPFGLGWSVDYPYIQRKTDKRLPRYRDGSEDDIFMFSGAEDLVPFLTEVNPGEWEEPDSPPGDYEVKKYRPRIEGGFARIEKISHPDHGVYWKVTTSENIATIFGRNTNSRIVDPDDETRVFQWLPEFSYDDKGNWIKYDYKEENLDNIPNEPHEKTVNLNHSFIQTGVKLEVKSTIFNPDNDSLSILAKYINTTGAYLDSVQMFDDGLHSDSLSNDGLYGVEFNVPDAEENYSLNVISQDLTTGLRHVSVAKHFTTKGPVTIDHIEYSTRDTIPNPNDLMRFKMYFKNNGSVASIKNIKITMAQIDSCVRPTNLSYRTIDVLEAGEIKEANGESSLKIENDCGEPGSYGVKLTISEGDYSYWSDTLYFDVVSGPAESEPEPELPKTFALYQNYPNPFNPATTIRYDLKSKSNVQLTIYDLAGRAIKTLVNQTQNAGRHAVEFDASDLSSGIYVYRIKTSAGFVASRKMVVLK